MKSRNNEKTENNDDKEEWLEELDEPNAMAYVMFNSRDYSKYFAKNKDWIHIRYLSDYLAHIWLVVCPNPSKMEHTWTP